MAANRVKHPGLHDAKGNRLAHRFIDVMGVNTHVVDAGDGPPVVLMHGYGDTADGWRRVVPGLLRDHRVIAADMPPFGRSELPPEPGNLLPFYKDFFPALLDELEIDKATLIGHSLGGAVALHVAIDNCDRVERLGLVAPAGLGKAPPWWWHALTARALWQGALSIPTPVTGPIVREGLKRFLAWRLVHDPRSMAHDIAHFADMHGSATSLKRLLAAGHACIDSYTGTLLEQSCALEIPIWMLWGEGDGLVPSVHARAFARAHPTAEVHVVDNCGHYPQIELPTRFNRLLRAWLQKTAPKPGRRRLAAAA